MKNKILGLLMIFAVNSALCSPINQSMMRLSPEEERALDALYMHDRKGTLLEALSMEHIDYYLWILPHHIKFLENERKNPSQDRDGVICASLMFTAMAIYSVVSLYNKIQQLMAGNLGRIWLSNEMLSDLRSIRFTRAEKKKLDQINFENINGSFYGSYDKVYTPVEEKKIVYLGKRLALKNIKKDIFTAGSMSAIGAMTTSFWYYELYNRYYGALARDQRLLEFLKNEKEQRMGNEI